MILTCKDCNTSFNFDERLINKSGSKVRCSNCQSVFVAYPPSPSDRLDTLSDTEAKPEDAISAAGGAAGLDDLDLDAIEKSLDLEADESQVAEATPVAESLDLDFDLDLEEDVAPVAAPDVEFEETQELDLSDFDMDEKSKSEEAAVETADDLSFDLDLDVDTADETPVPDEAGGEKSDDLDFDLDFDLDTDTGGTGLEEESAPVVEPAESATDDLDFSLDIDDDEAAAGAEDDLDFDLDLETEEIAEPAPDAAETPVAEEVDDLDFDLDLDLEPAAETEPIEAETDTSDGLDFDLDLESEPAGISTTDAVAGLEETEELDLTDLEDMIEVEDDTDMEGVADQTADDIDLDLELAAEDGGEEEALSSELELEETEELDLAGLEDALELEEDTSAGSFEDTDELDLDLDLDLGTDTGETVAAEPVAGFDGDEGEFDLSDMDDMLEIEEVPDAEDSEAQEEDFAIDLDDVDSAAGATADVELDIEFEDDEPDNAPAAAGSQDEEFTEAFDMGTLSDVEETVETGDGEDFFDAEEEEAVGVGKKRKKAAKKGIGGLYKILLVLVLLVGGGYGAVTLAPFFGIDLMEQVKSIPYVGEYFGPKVDQAGNLRITVLEKRLEGFFLHNSKLGSLYVVKGSVKNNYKHPRSFISITGKVYSKGAKLRQTKTVYAGNMLDQKQLTNLNQADIEKRLKRRSGQKQSNLKVQTGKVIPFMIVFTRVPKNLDEYTVQVAGSVKAKK